MPSLETLTSAYRDALDALSAARTAKDEAHRVYAGTASVVSGKRIVGRGIEPDRSPAAKRAFDVSKAGYARAVKAERSAARALAESGGDPIATAFGPERTRESARPSGTTRAEPIYVPGGKTNFWRDLATEKVDRSAAERLRRNDLIVGAELRDTDVPAGAGYLPPGYLGDQFSVGIRPGAVVRGACTQVEMPPKGISTAHIPSVTVGITVDGQADVDSDNLAATSDPETAYADSGMCTFAASIKADRQVFERGFAVGLEADAFSELDRAIDAQMISGTAGSGNGAGYDGLIAAAAQSYTYTNASPSAADFFDNLYLAQAQFAETRFAPAEYVLMHPRRAYELAGARDSSHPFFDQGGLAPGAANAAWSAGPLAGLRTLVSSGVPTDLGGGSNEDAVVLFRGSDVLFAMTAARFAFNEAASSMNAVVFQCVTYSYMWANRHSGNDVMVVSGTGLTPP